jgi:lipopolysaccharide export system protein LptA
MMAMFRIIALAVAATVAVAAFAQTQTTAPGVSALKGHNYNAPVDVSANGAEVQDRADRAVLVGNVHVTQGDLTLDTQRLTIAYANKPAASQPGAAPPAAQPNPNGTGIQIDRLDATGGVTVRSPSETAKGDFGVYDLNRKLITLVGNVQLVQGESNMQGSRLVIDLTSGRAVLDGGPPGVAQSGGRVTGHFIVPQHGQGQQSK